MKNLGLDGMVAELIRLNGKKAEFAAITMGSPTIYGTVPVESLVMPDGYYPNKQGHITNKKNVEKGSPYETFLYECNITYFAEKRRARQKEEERANNPLFKPIFNGSGKKKKKK